MQRTVIKQHIVQLTYAAVTAVVLAAVVAAVLKV
jgi:hypothetical protein